MEATDKIERIQSWIRSCQTDEQLLNLRKVIVKEFGSIPEHLRDAIDDQRIQIIKWEHIPTLGYHIF